jgi:hypothetical protein
MAYTQYTEINLETAKGKTIFLELHHSLSCFIALYKMFTYNIRFLPTSKTPIPNPQLENHGPKTHTMG